MRLAIDPEQVPTETDGHVRANAELPNGTKPPRSRAVSKPNACSLGESHSLDTLDDAVDIVRDAV